jgi:predicted DNA-binding helix-hairpin-helix protein
MAQPDLFQKVSRLSRAAQYDISTTEVPLSKWIYPASSGGRNIPLFKILMSNSCRNNCYYCANRSENHLPKYSFTSEELALAFFELHRRGLVEGIFLSSAVEDGSATMMERMLKAVEIIRQNYGFKGYVHLKIMPQAGQDYIERAVELADRVSINFEAPKQVFLSKISPDKDIERDLFPQMKFAAGLIKRGVGRAKSQTTQFVVGASGEKDQDLLNTCRFLYRQVSLERCYFSAFRPIARTPMEGEPPVSKKREHRLYQADFLIRKYHFDFNEIVFDEKGNLPLEEDPKLIWAKQHPEFFPIEVNAAEASELIRIPGIGPKTASLLLAKRRETKLKSIDDLKAAGVPLKHALPFILADGKMLELETGKIFD